MRDDEEGRILALHRLEVLDTPPEAPFENIVDLVKKILDVPMVAVSLVDRDRQWFKARRGLDVCETTRGVSFCSHTIQNSATLIVKDALQDDRFAGNPMVLGDPRIRAYAGVPLRSPDGYNVGSLCAIDIRPRTFPAAEVAVLESFAKLVMDELELRQIASTDYLTGALSRRAWMDQAEAEVERARRYGGAMSVAILDIDRFKSVNDTHGHPVGDLVIRSIARTCRQSIRASDVLARLGGEEFAILMPETAARDAFRLAERVRGEIADNAIAIGSGVALSVTISIGISQLGEEGIGLQSVLEAADRALYAAKNGGRNRTALADAAVPDPTDLNAAVLDAAVLAVVR